MFQLCVDKVKIEPQNKGRKRPPVESEGDEEVKRKRDRAESPLESVTSDSGSVADEAEPNEPSSVEPADTTNDIPSTETPTDVPELPLTVVKVEESPVEEQLPFSPAVLIPSIDNLPDTTQLPVFKVEDCNVVFNVGVPKKEISEPVVIKEEPMSESKSVITPQTFLQPPISSMSVPVEEEVKIKTEIKPKVEESFFSSLSVLQEKTLDPPCSGPLPRAFEEIPMAKQLTVKREGLFEPSLPPDGVIVPVLATSVENLVTKDEGTNMSIHTNSPMNASTNIVQRPQAIPPQQSNINTLGTATIKLEPGLSVCEDSSTNDSMNQPSSVADLTTSSQSNSSLQQAPLSPLPLTSYPPSSPRQHSLEPALDKSSPSLIHPPSIIVPTYPSLSSENEKTTLNIPSISSSTHHPGYSSYYHPHFHPHQSRMDKVNPSPTYMNSTSALQNEPQNLKIKQEVIPPDVMQPTADPLQSLKEVKVPGYSGSSSISQPLLPTTTTAPCSTQSEPLNIRSGSTPQPASPFLSGPSIDGIKKEPDSYNQSRTTPSKSPPIQTIKHMSENMSAPRLSPAPRSSSTHTPPFPPPPPPPVSHSTASLIAPSPTTVNPPTSIPQPVMHPSQQPSPSQLSRISPGHLAHPHPYVPAIHHPHPHPLIHHSLFAAAAAHAAAAVHHNPYHPHHPYGGYPYPFPYGPYPIPQPVPPPSRSHEPQKRESLESTTMMTSHHSSHSSVTTRSLREVETREESSSNPHHTTQEITQTHHHSTSHHSSVHHHSGEKQSPLTISHSTTSSSSASVQHKINSSKRGASPAANQQV